MSESDIPKTADVTSVGGDSATVGDTPRRAAHSNFFAAIKHINDASVSDGVHQRFSDYVTIGLVLVCVLSLGAAISLPVAPALKLLPLVFTVGAVVFYIINRLGILLSLSQRQALIVWQIMIAAFWLGVTSAMLVMMICTWFFNGGLRS